MSCGFRKESLSDWINEGEEGYCDDIYVGHIKQSIKKLKEEFPCVMKKRKCKKDYKIICSGCKVRFKIDEHFGKKLIEEVSE